MLITISFMFIQIPYNKNSVFITNINKSIPDWMKTNQEIIGLMSLDKDQLTEN